MDLVEISSTLVNEMAAPSQHAIDAEAQKEPAVNPPPTPKKRGRPSGTPKSSSILAPTPPQTQARDTSTAAGTGLATTFFLLARVVGGEEWEPEKGEREAVNDACINYAKSKNLSDIPPGVMLVTVLIAYAVPRFSKPITLTRTQRLYFWFQAKFGKKNATRSDSGNDGKRENVAG